MKLIKSLAMGLTTAIVLGASALQASAVSTFASFSFVGTPDGSAKFVLSGTNFAATTFVNFNYVASGVSDLGILLPGTVTPGVSYRAILLMTGSLTGNVTSVGPLLRQGAKDIEFTLFTTGFLGDGTTPGGPAAFDVFLGSGTAYTGRIGGRNGGSTGSLSSSEPAGDNVNFISTVATLPPLFDRDSSFTFDSIKPILGISGTNLRDFESSIAGIFSADSVPEPGSLALLVGSGVSVGLLRRRRRK